MADSQDRLTADLRSLPSLKPEVETVYLHGGWNLKGKKPEQFVAIPQKVGKDINGRPLYGTKIVDRMKETNRRGFDESPPPLEQSSAESTLHLIRHMRNAGWDKITTLTMMSRPLAKGAAWLLWFRDFDEEFERCWEKAGRPVASFVADKPKQNDGFASNMADRSKVFTLIELYADAGQPIHKRGLYDENPLDGKNWKGRIDAAVDVLKEEGLITSDPQGRGKPTYYAPVTVRFAYREESSVDHYGIDDAVSLMPLDFDFDFDVEEEPMPDWRERGKKIGLIGALRYVSRTPLGGDISDADLARIFADW